MDADPTIESLALQYGFDYEVAEQNLALLYRIAHDHILEAVQRAILARPDQTPTQLIRLLNVVDAQYARALTGGARLVGSNTLNAFNVGAQAAEEQMARQRVRLQTSWTQVNRGAVQALQQEQMNDLLRATTFTEEQVKARVRRVMLEETRQLAATGMRAKEQAKVISERMAEDGVFGITAKNGRHIPMDEYARVVAHTKLREAHTTGTEHLVAENGHDLVRVTTHLHRPDACSPLEGKVYSISGRTPGYPPLVRHTPFHPGCRHVETPFIETFRSEAELEKTREESNRPGQITVYPQAQLDELEAKQKKRQRFMRAKRELRKQDQIDIGAGKKDAPKDPKAYERSLTARANARVRKQLASVENPDKKGAYKRLPQTGEVTTTTLLLGPTTSVTVRNHWVGTSELENVQRGLRLFRPELMDGLSVRYTNGLLRHPSGLARALYTPDTGEMLLGRRSDRDFSSSSTRVSRRAQHTIWHEASHHVYNLHVAPNAAVLADWIKLQPAGFKFDSDAAHEQFATQFVASMRSRKSTPLNEFFSRFTR